MRRSELGTMAAMLTIWRRHAANCKHREKGRDYLKCSCPIWADGYVNGERTLRQSLKTRDMAKARKRAMELESSDAPRAKTVKDASDAFLKHCRDLSPATRTKYRNVMQHLLAFCNREGLDILPELSVEQIDAYRESREIGPLTATKELQTLRQFFGFCVERKWLTENAAKKVNPPRNVRSRPVEPYTKEEMGKILLATDAFGRAHYERLRARAMILVLRHTGLRISDVATLARERIRNGEMFLHTLKTGGMIKLPVPAELEHALAVLPVPKDAEADCPYFFWNGKMSERAVIRNARRTLTAVFRKAGIRNGRTHRFRHTLATEILIKGGTEQDAADVLGISPGIVRAHYAKWTQARQDRISLLMRQIQGVNEVVEASQQRPNVN